MTPQTLPLAHTTENPLIRLRRSLRTAVWLGWQIESNWTDPFIFAIYSIIRPVSSALILVVMYNIITDGNTAAPIFSYLFLGQAFYQYVGAVVAGVSWAVIDDREHYQMLRFIYIAPIYYPAYLIGRGATRFLTGTIGVTITMVFGVLFFNVHLAPLAEIDWGLFALSMGLGVFGLIAMGMILAGVTLMLRSHAMFLGEAVAGALYLFSGAIFPLEVLPEVLRPIGFALPLTYWLELVRRALLGEGAAAFPTLAGFSTLEVIGLLTAITILYSLIATFVFMRCDSVARKNGLIDMQSFY